MRLKLIPVFTLIWFIAASFPVTGNAAPQILGLVATTTPLPLSCVEGVCSVEVSGVCLQEHRQAPESGTAYQVAKGTKLTLVVRDQDGKTKTMVVDGQVEIRSLRLFNSLSIRLPESLVKELSENFVLASLSVAPLTSLVPIAKAGDPNPLSDKEIREYTGHLRTIAERAFGYDKANLNATRILNHMVNQLHKDIPVGQEGIANLLASTKIKNSAAEMPSVSRLVNRALDTCREKLRVERTPHLRACISNQHDILNSNTTQNVWRSLRPSG